MSSRSRSAGSALARQSADAIATHEWLLRLQCHGPAPRSCAQSRSDARSHPEPTALPETCDAARSRDRRDIETTTAEATRATTAIDASAKNPVRRFLGSAGVLRAMPAARRRPRAPSRSRARRGSARQAPSRGSVETTFSSVPSISPVKVERGGDVSRVMAARSSPAVAPVNGRLPASIS